MSRGMSECMKIGELEEWEEEGERKRIQIEEGDKHRGWR